MTSNMPHKTTEQMNKELVDAWSFFASKLYWKHYKGGHYRVAVDKENPFVFSTDNGELMVTYTRIGGPNFNVNEEYEITYARPFREWKDTIEVDGEMVPRFVAIKQVSVWVERD